MFLGFVPGFKWGFPHCLGGPLGLSPTDSKHDLQAPTSYKIWSLANHFAKATKYMTEEIERYMDHLKLQAIYDLTGSRIQGGVSAYNLIGSRTRGYKPPTTLLDSKSEGTQVACDLIGSRTRHTR
jgi:hypothetical protein